MSNKIGPNELRGLGLEVNAQGRPTLREQLRRGVIRQITPGQPLTGFGRPVQPVFGQPAAVSPGFAQPAQPVFGQPAAVGPVFGQPAQPAQPVSSQSPAVASLFGQPAPLPAGPAAGAVPPQPALPGFGSPGVSIFGGPAGGPAPSPAGPPSAGPLPPGTQPPGPQPPVQPPPGFLPSLVQAAINRQPIVWRVPAEVWLETTKYWDALSLLRAVIAEPLIFHSRRFSILSQDPIYQRQWERRDHGNAPIERFPLLWEAVDKSFPIGMIETLTYLYQRNHLSLNASWSRRMRRMQRILHIVGGRMQNTTAIRAFEQLRPDALTFLLRRGALMQTGSWHIEYSLNRLWRDDPERQGQRFIADFEYCMSLLVLNGYVQAQIIQQPRSTLYRRYSIVTEAARRGLPRLFDACVTVLERNPPMFDMLLDHYVHFVSAFFLQPAPRVYVTPMVQRLYRLMTEAPATGNYDARKTGGHVVGDRRDSHPHTVRAYILFCALRDQLPYNNLAGWLLNQNGQERCDSLGKIDPFAYLLFPGKRKRWHDPQFRAAYEYDMDRLINTRDGGIEGLMINLAATRSRQDISGPPPQDVPATELTFWRASLRIWPNLLSFALEHWIGNEYLSGVTRERSAGLNVAFYLMSRGADPGRVQLRVQQRMSQEWFARQVAYNNNNVNNDYPPVQADAAAGRTAWSMCNQAGDAVMDYTLNPARRAMVVLYFVANNTNVVPANSSRPIIFY